MSKQYPGGIVSKTAVVPTSLVAPGIWTLSQQAAAQATNTWPFPRDPQFKNVTMLLHGDGSAGAVATGSGAGASPVVTNFNADASTNNFNVTINGDARSNNFNPYQEGYYSNYLNGSSNFTFGTTASNFLCTGSATGITATFEAWVFLTAYSTGANSYNFSAIHAKGGVYFNFGVRNGAVRFYWYDGAQKTVDSASTSDVPLNTWTHIALTISGSTFKIYINGVLNTTSATYTGVQSAGSGTTEYIGLEVNGTYLNGYISNYRFTNTVVYSAAFTPSTTPLTAISGTQFLSCQSNRFIDNSTNAFTITLVSSPQVSPAQPFTLPSSVATYGSGYFDGTGDYLTIADNAALELSTSSFTMEWWSYPTTFASNQFQLSKCATSAATEGFLTYINTSGVLKFNANSVSAWDIANDQGTLALKLNAWNHCAISRSGSSWRMWVNGVSSVTITSALGVQNTTTAYSIGGAANGSAPFLGYTTDTRIVIGSYVYDPASSTITIPTAPLTAITNTSLLTTQYNGGGNNSGFKDSSQFNFPITRNGNTTQGTFTPYGSNWSNYFPTASINTSGSGLIAGTNTFTLEFWIFPTAGTADDTIVDTRTSNGADATAWLVGLTGLSTGDGVLKWLLNGTGNASLGGTVPKNQWSHIVVTRNSSNVITGYVNGVATGTTQTDSRNLTNTNFLVGGNVTTPTGTWYLSNVRWVVGSVVYSSNFTPSTTPLTAITNTKLLTCQSNRYVDNSGNGYTFTQTGSPTVQRFSPFAPLTVYNPTTYGGSAYFDGSGDYLSVASNAAFGYGTGDFSLEFWAYPSVSSDNNRVIWHTNDDFNLELINSGGSLLQFFSGSARTSTPYTYTVNAWNHCAITRQSGTARMFINGKLVNNFAFTSSKATTALNIASNGSVYFTGNLTDVRIVKGGIPSAYVTASTTNGTQIFTPPTAPFTSSDSLSAGSVSLLTNMTNAGILDNSMMNNLETVGNAQISTSVVKYGTASIYFEGSSPYGYLKGNANLSQNVAFGAGDFTVECWVYLTTTASDSVIIDARPGSNSANYFLFYLWTNAGTQQPTIAWYSPTSYVLSTGTVSSGVWTHLAICRSSGTIRSFKDGVLQQSASDTRSYANPGAPYPYIGAGYSVTIDSFKGYIDDFRITKYARYTATFTPPTQAFPNG